MLAIRRRMKPVSLNSQFSLPYERNQWPESSCHSYAKRTAMRFSWHAHNSLIKQTIFDLSGPLASKKLLNGVPAGKELGAISPDAVGCIRERHTNRVASIPSVFG